MARCKNIRELKAGQARREITDLTAAVDTFLAAWDVVHPQVLEQPLLRDRLALDQAVESLRCQRDTLTGTD